MNSFVIYLLKVCIGISFFVIPYYFFLRKDANLILKRFYLLGGMVLSFIFPLLALKQPEITMVYSPMVDTEPLMPAPEITVMPAETVSHFSINWPTVILAVYLCGILVLLFRNVFMLLKWNAVWNRADRKSTGIAYSGNDEILAIFSRIFLPERLKDIGETDTILLHERAHIRQAHFIDLLLMECVLIITWFNPFTWLTSWMMKENHEHLADRTVLQKGIDQSEYRAQLLNQTLGVNIFSLGYKFNQSFITKRFEMMKRSKSLKAGLFKVLILVSLVFLTLGLTVSKNRQSSTISGKVVFSDTGQPAHGASIIVRGTTTGTIADKEGNYQIELKERAEIVFSFVGYKTQSYWFNPGEYRFVVLERQAIPLPNVVQSKLVYTDSIKPLEILIVDGVQQKNKTLKDIDTSDILRIKTYDKFGKEGGKDMIVVTTKKKQQNLPDNIESPDSVFQDLNKVQIRRNPETGFPKPLVFIDGVQQPYEMLSKIDPGTIEKVEVHADDSLVKLHRQFVEKLSPNVEQFKKEAEHLRQQAASYKQIGDESEYMKVTEQYKQIQEKYRQEADKYKQEMEQSRKKMQDTIRVTTKKTSTNDFDKTPGDETGYEKRDLKFVPKEEPAFYIVTDPPLFNGGDAKVEFPKYIRENLKYPSDAIERRISGRVIVQFVVDTSGTVKDAVLAVSKDPLLDKEALRVVLSSPPWTPGKQRGRKVPVFFTFPVQFTLQENAEQKTEPVLSTQTGSAQVNPSRTEPTFYVVEEMPLFNNGDPSKEFTKYISENLVYPEEERQKGIEGQVRVQFIIRENGSVSNVKIVSPDRESFNKEAVRVIGSSPAWKPGKQRGKAVPVFYTMPVIFKLMVKNQLGAGSKNLEFLSSVNSVRIIKNPRHGSTSAPYVKIARIELSKSGTVLCFDVTFRPQYWIRVPDRTYIKPVNSENKLYIRSAEGIPMNDRYYMPDSGRIFYKLFFPALDENVAAIDYGEGHEQAKWFINNIELWPR